uniref:PH domain-containing protein n=1 Tax=Peronospora matthiolae TaxID=2874970 RepID=A0AAV1UCE6_9STRA
MRVIQETHRLECESRRRASRRSQFRKWLESSTSQDGEREEHGVELPLEQQIDGAFALFAARRPSNVVSPLLPSSLKKAPSPLAVKWSSYIGAMGLKDTRDKPRHVHFAAQDAEHYDSMKWTEDEKSRCYYSSQELDEMETLSRQHGHRGVRFTDQPEDTVLEQGFLSLPVSAPFLQTRRYYCLLRGHRLQLFSSAVHAGRNSGPKEQLTVLRVQDCQTLSTPKKFALFGAELPPQMSLMFYVIKANGERVILTADAKSSKRNWVHALTRLTYVGEGESCSSTSVPRTRSSSAPMLPTSILSPVLEAESEEEVYGDMTVVGSMKMERRSSCTATCS